MVCHLDNWPATLFPNISWKEEKKTKLKKGLPSKDTSVLYRNTPLLTRPITLNSFDIFQSSAFFIWTGPYWFMSSQSTGPDTWSGSGRWRKDHLCLGVFFFRFRLKKQQHLRTEEDIKPRRRWWSKGKNKHEQTAYISMLNITRAWFVFQFWS